MLDAFFRLLNQMDSFRKVALLAMTGLTALSIYLGYRAVENYSKAADWDANPHILRTELPCSLVQLRSDYYLVSISFPKPDQLPEAVTAFTSSLWVTSQPKGRELTDLCNSLIRAVNSNEAESLLAPYLKQRAKNTAPSNLQPLDLN